MIKKISVSLICLSCLLLLSSCSAVKVMDSWKSDKIEVVKDNSFLVVARANNPKARMAFEDEIVNQMQEKGYKATASYKKFKGFKPNETKPEQDKEKLKNMLKTEGFNAVVLTVMKDYKEDTKVDQDGGYMSGGTVDQYYPGYYGIFYPYFYNPMSYHTSGVYVEETITTSTYKVYVLETTIYDLEQTGKDQLVAVITSKIENPSTASGSAYEYVRKISAKLKK